MSEFDNERVFRMGNRSGEVDEFLDALSHPLSDEVKQLRLEILEMEPRATEHIKWNAPSFCIDGVDLITFNLRPMDRIQLIFHRGAKVRVDADAFTFVDDSGLVKWITSDRGSVTLLPGELNDRRPQLLKLVGAWLEA
jgi:hypothetical protein